MRVINSLVGVSSNPCIYFCVLIIVLQRFTLIKRRQDKLGLATLHALER